MSKRSEVLVLGGTAEALTIAERLSARDDVHVVVALSGREETTQKPLSCDVRIGAFADAAALADFVAERSIDLLIDACEPFAGSLRRHAAQVAVSTGIARVVFERPAHAETDDDAWIRVRHTAEAADLLPGFARRVLLDLPAGDLGDFARLSGLRFLLRGVGQEDIPLHDYEHAPGAAATADEEAALLRQRNLDMVVLRENGSDASATLLDAARATGLPAMLLERPALPPSRVMMTVDEVVEWAQARLDGPSKAGGGDVGA